MPFSYLNSVVSKPAAQLVAKAEGDPGVDHGLTLHHIQVKFHRDVDVGKDLQIGLPVEEGAGLFPVSGFLLKAAHIFALFKVEGVFEAVPVDDGVEGTRWHTGWHRSQGR